MPEIALENELLRVFTDPDHGTGILACYVKRDNAWLPLMPDTRHGASELRYASFLMAPYSNRIENGAFSFEGKSYQLRDGKNHAIHGDVRFRSWLVEEESSTRVRCAFRSTEHENVNWPWPFEMSAEYSVSGPVFSSRLTLWNRSRSTMPAGFGWHPYFSRALTRDGEPVHLQMKVAGVYPDANGNRIPSGPPQALVADQDFSTEGRLTADNLLDACFQGYDGKGHILWPESGIRISFDCSPECTHLIIYNPAESPHFAVEPVTNANNGVNILSSGGSDSGVVALSPGESLKACFDLRVSIEEG